MFRYIGLRFFQALLGLWFIATLVFVLSRSIGDPAEIFTARNSGVDAREITAQKLGLDKPLYHQYALYMGQLARGNLGQSVRNGNGRPGPHRCWKPAPCSEPPIRWVLGRPLPAGRSPITTGRFGRNRTGIRQTPGSQ